MEKEIIKIPKETEEKILRELKVAIKQIEKFPNFPKPDDKIFRDMLIGLSKKAISLAFKAGQKQGFDEGVAKSIKYLKSKLSFNLTEEDLQ